MEPKKEKFIYSKEIRSDSEEIENTFRCNYIPPDKRPVSWDKIMDKLKNKGKRR